MEPAKVDTGKKNRSFLPPFGVLLFALHLTLVVLKPDFILSDPGTGWHLKTGSYIIQTASIPTQDLFSWTMAGQPWVAYQWLFQTILGYLQSLGGLPLAAAFGACIYGAIPVIVYSTSRNEGATAPVALLAAVAAHHVLEMHAFLRPHIFTYLFFAIFARRLREYETGRSGWKRLTILPPLMVLWANLHPAFPIGIVLIGGFLAAEAARWLLRRNPLEAGKVVVLAALAAACTAASLANPRGWRLHTSIVSYLNLDALRWWVEYRSPNFQEDGFPATAFLAMLLPAIALLGRPGGRLHGAEFILLPLFLHMALISRRHLNLCAILLAPVVAREFQRAIEALVPRVATALWRCELGQRRLGSGMAWIAILASSFFAWSQLPCSFLRKDLDDILLSRSAALFIESQPSRFARLYNSDYLGGSIIYRFWPRIRVFMDDRTDLYRDAFTTNTYFAVFHLRTNWSDTLDAWGISAVVTPQNDSLNVLLAASTNWTLAYKDSLNAIYFPASSPEQNTPPVSLPSQLTAPRSQ